MSIGEQGCKVKETEEEEKGTSVCGLRLATSARSSLLFTVMEQNDKAPIRGNKPAGVIVEKNCVLRFWVVLRAA